MSHFLFSILELGIEKAEGTKGLSVVMSDTA